VTCIAIIASLGQGSRLGPHGKAG